jgi:hypothetical protein
MKKLKIVKSIKGSLASENHYFETVKNFEGAIFEISNDILILYYNSGKIEEYNLIFLEKDYPMLIRRGLFKDKVPFRVITSDYNENVLTIGSMHGIGYAVNFELNSADDDSYAKPSYNADVSEYINNLQEQLTIVYNRDGRVTIPKLEEMVINFACLEILMLKRQGINDRIVTDSIINGITTAASQIVSEYDESHAEIAKSSISMNCNWDGMWDHLKKYYKKNFNSNIE